MLDMSKMTWARSENPNARNTRTDSSQTTGGVTGIDSTLRNSSAWCMHPSSRRGSRSRLKANMVLWWTRSHRISVSSPRTRHQHCARSDNGLVGQSSRKRIYHMRFRPDVDYCGSGRVSAAASRRPLAVSATVLCLDGEHQKCITGWACQTHVSKRCFERIQHRL